MYSLRFWTIPFPIFSNQSRRLTTHEDRQGLLRRRITLTITLKLSRRRRRLDVDSTRRWLVLSGRDVINLLPESGRPGRCVHTYSRRVALSIFALAIEASWQRHRSRLTGFFIYPKWNGTKLASHPIRSWHHGRKDGWEEPHGYLDGTTTTVTTLTAERERERGDGFWIGKWTRRAQITEGACEFVVFSWSFLLVSLLVFPDVCVKSWRMFRSWTVFKQGVEVWIQHSSWIVKNNT